MWRELAEQARYWKGMLVYVEGKLTHRKWQDRDGKDHYAAEVTVDLLKILERRRRPFESTSSNVNAPEHREPTRSPGF